MVGNTVNPNLVADIANMMVNTSHSISNIAIGIQFSNNSSTWSKVIGNREDCADLIDIMKEDCIKGKN